MLDQINDTSNVLPRPKVPDGAPAVHPKLGQPSTHYVYTDETGAPFVVVYRFDNSDNSANSPSKGFRPFDLKCRKWKAPDLRPLYRIDALREHDGPVVIVEGEKCADALNDLGILATTAFGGCNGVGKTDFSPLRNREVIIWPDNDEPGLSYREKVAIALAKENAASVRIVDLNSLSLAKGPPKVSGGILDTLGNVFRKSSSTYTLGKVSDGSPCMYTLRKGWDVADAITDGWDRTRIREFLKASVPYTYTGNTFKGDDPFKGKDAPIREGSFKGIDLFKDKPLYGNGDNSLKENPTPVVDDSLKLKEWGEPDMSVLNPRRSPPEFPLSLFGPFWSKWIASEAEGCSAPPDYIGMTLLTATSALIGCSRRISPWNKWKEPPMLWTALVGDPSSNKSPALDTVLNILRKIEVEGVDDLKEKLRAYEAEVLAAQCIRQDWEKDLKEIVKAGGARPPLPANAVEPDKPERPRIFVSDTTPEALARLLSHNEKGLLTVRDELAGWLGSFDRYSGGKGGDRAFWLEAFGGRPYTIDRARNGGEAITIPHLAASIIGGIQPDKLQSLLLKGDDDGLTARLLYIWPDKVPLKRPQDSHESPEAEQALRWLNSLKLVSTDENGTHAAICKLTEEAANNFQDWRVNHGNAQPEGPLAGWWGKMPGLCLRLALCFDYLDRATTSREETYQIEPWVIEAAATMIDDYLKPMAARTYGDASRPQAERNAATLAKWIKRERPERFKVRDLYRQIRLPGLTQPADAKEAVQVLIDADWVRPAPSRAGGSKGKLSGEYEVNPEMLNGLERAA